MEMKWYLICTKTNCEKQVADTLSRKKIINYLPANKVVKRVSRNKKFTEEPLLPQYLFVRLHKWQHIELTGIRGIINFVYWLGNPAVIRDEEIEMIANFLKDHINVSIKKFTSGFKQVTKYSSMCAANSSLIPFTNKIILESLGYIMTGEAEPFTVRILPKENIIKPRLIQRRFLNPIISLDKFLKFN